MSPGVGVAGAAAWGAGEWLGAGDGALERVPTGVRAELAALDTLGATRVARADRLTRIAVGVAARALARAVVDVCSEELAVLVGSCLASAHTNERYELRRQRTGNAAPREFPYTAPNAWGGELAAALGARGPSASFVGGSEAGLVALARAQRWLEAGLCPAALVVVAECPPDAVHLVAPAADSAAEAAAALVLVPPTSPSLALLHARFEASVEDAPLHDRLLSVGPLARLALAAQRRQTVVVFGRPKAGAAVRVDLSPAPP